MLEKLRLVEERYMEIERRLSDPNVYADREQVTRLSREQKELTPLVEAYRAYRMAEREASEARALLDDHLEADFREMVQEEYDRARSDMERLEQEMKVLLLPADPNDQKNVIVEIRGGAGGEEAALFAASLFRMYSMYAERCRWKVEITNINETELGGIKEISFMIVGEGAFSRLKFESGVHRVQRVPDTESSGRVHTSTVTVAVLPEAEDVELELNPADIQTDTFRSSGAGGQHVNKTESAIRLTHIPTGIVVECQDERSQYKNRERAMKILRSKLLDAKRQEQTSAIAAERRSQVGTGDRSERIRTYNFPQGRVTDHRIGLTLYKIDAIMNGDLDELVDTLVTADQAERLRAGEES
ncbi:peptide chain release factor 1 [Papillibacter cinnamivorans]|uniref:Peptide chain release factor 1 n=1 Tax=Papillibacter cinnamivorans DSM 12816 TaxID=1122930 RepID=A0A1W1YKA1_9FIRM|nr:peptide chain release factor 1 [Papillibacter cinnamivorans]SMC36221.1 peptide chain release factor 1 [Papillibacter cinnamivorans DSM 12816]